MKRRLDKDATFLSFYAPLWLNGKAVVLYRTAKPGVLATVETTGGKLLAAKRFDSVDALDAAVGIEPAVGNGASRLAAAIELLTREHITFEWADA
jgi:hypothetical protein